MIVNKPKKKKKLLRFNVYFIIMGIIFTVIIVKLLYIQVYKHEDYKEKADTTATKFISEKAPRGNIYDSNGNVLATNQQTYIVTYTSTTDAEENFFQTVDLLVDIIGDNLTDDLKIKVDDNDEVYFKYSSTDESSKESERLRFLKDRGFDEDIQNELFPDVESDNLKDEQLAQINSKLLDISDEEIFYELVKDYDLIKLVDPNPNDEKKKQYDDMSGEELTKIILKDYSMSDIRKYMVVKDALHIQTVKNKDNITLASNIDKDTASIVYQRLNDLPGVDVNTEPVRYYPYKNLASSVLGYISSINSSSAEVYELKGYDTSSDLVGVSGIEAAFEDQLKGVKGGTTVKVNSKGRVTQNLYKLESYPGNNVHLTIDKNLQSVAENSLKDSIAYAATTSDNGHSYSGANRGAAVVVNVKTGEILASVSYPDFDPSDFASGKLSDEKKNEYLNPDYEAYAQYIINKFGLNKTVNDLFPLNEDGSRSDPYDLYPKPLYNYATQGLIPPGSTFKPMTALVGLEEGVITTDETIYDSGVFNIHPEVYGTSFGPKCWKSGGHGSLNVCGAIEQSCNFFFYEVAYRLYEKGLSEGLSKTESLNAVAKYAWKFGLGYDPENTNVNKTTGIEIDERYGQTYNFETNKQSQIATSKYKLRDILESGLYQGSGGTISFCPFDYSDSEDDSQKLKDAKTSLKNKIKEELNKVGTEKLSADDFSAEIVSDVTDIMNYSEKYQTSLASFSSSTTIDKQSKIVANVIAMHTISDIATQITSPGEQVNGAIGQGINNFSLMQMAQYVSTLANKGTRYKLHFVSKITNPDGDVIQEYSPEVLDETEISDSTWNAIVAGMESVDDGQDGTAAAAFEGFPTDVIKTAGKTGTADSRDDQYEVGRAPYATYVGFAPAEDPEIAVVSVIYDGGHGGSAARVAKAVYEEYFKDRILAVYPNYPEYSSTYQKYIANLPADNKSE